MSTELVGAAVAREHRHLMTYFPTGAPVVAAMDGAETPYGITCSSLANSCLEPPTLLASLGTRSRTLQAVEVGDHTGQPGVVHNVKVSGGSPLRYGLRGYRSWQ